MTHPTIKIVFENDDLLVLDKPSGMVVNISQTSPENTLQDWTNEYLKLNPAQFDISDPIQAEYLNRGGIVHRLDKETSGLLVVAKSPESFEDLKEEFKSRSVKKEYRAIIIGELPENLIDVNAPIARDPKNRFRQAIVQDGREATTRFEKHSLFEEDGVTFSHIKAFPLTGRTHQIRVHLFGLGLSILGDSTYGGSYNKKICEKYNVTRMLLHAHRLSIKDFNFEALIPADFDFLPK